MANRAFQGVLLMGVALLLVHCADDTKKVTTSSEDGGEANGGEAPSSGGSGDIGDTAGAPTVSGGMPGSAGEAGIEGGSGGVPSTAGTPNASGAGGELGVAGGGSCVPTDCCTSDQPTCEAGWDTECSGTGNYQTCCDPATGVFRDCGYGGGGIDRNVSVCINDCTSKSYATNACTCLGDQDPACDTDWTGTCGTQGKVYCSDPVAGYRLSCVDVDQTVEPSTSSAYAIPTWKSRADVANPTNRAR